MTSRLEEPGWVRIGLYDAAERRSLWVRYTDDAIELCAGREGDDAYMKLDKANQAFGELLEILQCALFAREQLIDNLTSHAIVDPIVDPSKRDERLTNAAWDVKRDVARELVCRASPEHEHEPTGYWTVERCPLADPKVTS